MTTAEEFKTRFIALLEEFGATIEEYENEGYGEYRSTTYYINVGDKSFSIPDLWWGG